MVKPLTATPWTENQAIQFGQISQLFKYKSLNLPFEFDKRQGEQNYEMCDGHQNTVQPNDGDKVLAGDKQQMEQNYEMWDSNSHVQHVKHVQHV